MTAPARCYLHFRSPYSYLAVKRIVAEGIPVDPAVFFSVPASLSTKAGEKPDPAKTARLAYIGEDVTRLARRRDVPLQWPKPFDCDWIRVAAAVERARADGAVMAFVAAAFERRWAEGRDLGDLDTMAAVAADSGLDAPSILAAMDDPVFHEKAKAAIRPGVEAGVFGVPFFLYDDQKFWGQDRIDLLKEAMGL